MAKDQYRKENSQKGRNLINRRNFLLSGLGVLMGGGIYLANLKQKPAKYSLEEVGHFLKKLEIDPYVIPSDGKKSLLLIEHAGGNTVQNCIKNLGRSIKIDQIYMQGAYADGGGSDPYTACQRDRVAFQGGTFSKEKIYQEDQNDLGYFDLSRKFSVKGVESKDLSHDLYVLEEMKSLSLKLFRYGSKDAEIEKKLRGLDSSLKIRSPQLPDHLDRDKIFGLVSQASLELELIERNKYIAGIVDQTLSEEGFGIFAASPAHIKPFYSGNREYSTILPAFTEKGIDTMVLSFDQAIALNKKLQPK